MKKLNVVWILINKKLLFSYILLRDGTNVEALTKNFLDENMIDAGYIVNNHEGISFCVIVRSSNSKQSSKLLDNEISQWTPDILPLPTYNIELGGTKDSARINFSKLWNFSANY